MIFKRTKYSSLSKKTMHGPVFRVDFYLWISTDPEWSGGHHETSYPVCLLWRVPSRPLGFRRWRRCLYGTLGRLDVRRHDPELVIGCFTPTRDGSPWNVPRDFPFLLCLWFVFWCTYCVPPSNPLRFPFMSFDTRHLVLVDWTRPSPLRVLPTHSPPIRFPPLSLFSSL